MVILLQREKRKLRNRVMSLVRSQRLIKQSVKLSMTGKMMSGPLKLKDGWLLWMTYVLKTQCTVYSLVEIQRIALCRKNVEDIQLQTKKQCNSKSLNISSFIQMSSLIWQFWGKWWKKSWVVIFYILYKKIFCGPVSLKVQ